MILLLPAAAFAYVPLLLLYGFDEGAGYFWGYVGIAWLLGLICVIAVFLTRRSWKPKTLALAAMAVKLLHIPAYVFWFLFALAAIPFGGPVIAFVFDVMTITLSGILGVAAVARSRRAGALDTAPAIGLGVLQFVFCADIIAGIVIYCISRKCKEETL